MTEVKGPKTSTSGEIDLSAASGPSAAVGLEQETIGSSNDQKFIPVGRENVNEIVAAVKSDTHQFPVASGEMIRAGGEPDDLRSDPEHAVAGQESVYRETVLPLSEPVTTAPGSGNQTVTGVIAGRNIEDSPEAEEQQANEPSEERDIRLGRRVRMPLYRAGDDSVGSFTTIDRNGRFSYGTGNERTAERLEDIEAAA